MPLAKVRDAKSHRTYTVRQWIHNYTFYANSAIVVISTIFTFVFLLLMIDKHA